MTLLDTSYHKRRLDERMRDPEFRREYEATQKQIAQVDAILVDRAGRRGFRDMAHDGDRQTEDEREAQEQRDAFQVFPPSLRSATCTRWPSRPIPPPASSMWTAIPSLRTAQRRRCRRAPRISLTQDGRTGGEGGAQSDGAETIGVRMYQRAKSFHIPPPFYMSAYALG